MIFSYLSDICRVLTYASTALTCLTRIAAGLLAGGGDHNVKLGVAAAVRPAAAAAAMPRLRSEDGSGGGGGGGQNMLGIRQAPASMLEPAGEADSAAAGPDQGSGSGDGLMRKHVGQTVATSNPGHSSPSTHRS